jgi:oligopeptide/dipeptide ABC transporter ATP-binding protein
MNQAIVEVRNLVKHFPVRGNSFFGKAQAVHAVDGVSFTVAAREALGLVGETGSGKSTLARLILRLIRATSGSVTFEGRDVLRANAAELKTLRRRMQIIFQDSHGALDPLMKLGASVEVPLAQHGIGDRGTRRRAVASLLESVGLDASFAERYPEECSGGQLSRVVIARALSLSPQFLVCDEPTASLDASIRSQVLNLLVDLRRQLGLTILLISHDLRTVRYLCDRVAVMYLGQLVEIASQDEIFERPLHPYTRALMAAAFPESGRITEQPVLHAEPPSPIEPPRGCRFETRCPIARPRCRSDAPALTEVRPGHWVACHFWDIGVEVPRQRIADMNVGTQTRDS